MTPRLVILGKSGQMAHALAERAKAKSIDCLFLGRDDLDLAQMPLPQTLEDVPADLKQAITSFAPTHILNSAAYTAVDKAEEERDAAFALNEDGARLAARLARLFDVGFIHISTDYVFDGTKEGAYGEDDLTAPQSVYGLSKLAGEKAVCAEHSGAVIIRTSWIISAYGNNFLKSMVRLGQEREALSIVADQTGCPTPALDLADALLAIVQQVPATAAAHERAGIYHACGQGKASWYDLASHIFEVVAASGQPVPTLTAIPTTDYPTPARRPVNSVMDCHKLAQQFDVRLPSWRVDVEKSVLSLIK